MTKLQRRAQRLRMREEEPVTFYWAYGSNLSVKQMKRRCPDARKHSKLIVPNGQLVFRGVADVESIRGGGIQGGLWRITRRCERALDQYEGVASGLYEKKYMRIRTHADGEEHRVLYYKMTSGGVAPPPELYLDTIIEGYDDFDLDLTFLDEAVQRSWNSKDWTQHLRQRHERRGRPRLASRYYVPIIEEEEVKS